MSDKFPVLENEGFDRLAINCTYPEPRLFAAGTKLRRVVNNSLTKASQETSKTKSALIEAAIEGWLRGNGYLK